MLDFCLYVLICAFFSCRCKEKQRRKGILFQSMLKTNIHIQL